MNIKTIHTQTNKQSTRKKAKWSKNPPSKIICVRNLSSNIDDEKCREFFQDCGQLVDISWMSRKKGVCYVEFATQEQADKACSKRGTLFMGRQLKCNYVKNTKRKAEETFKLSPPTKRIFISNLPPYIDDAKCRQFFQDCGQPVDISWMSRKKGVCFVEFATQKQADKACLKRGTLFMDRKLECNYAKNNKKRKAEETNKQSPRKKVKNGSTTPPSKKISPPNKRIFISNLSYDLNDEKCKEFFQDCGELLDIFWMKGVAIIDFATQEEADKACLKNGTLLMGRKIGCQYAKEKQVGAGKKTKINPPCKRIYMGNVKEMNVKKFKKFWKSCGELVDIVWVKDRKTQLFKGAVIFEFATQEQADKAVLKNGTKFGGREVTVAYAKQGRYANLEKYPGCDTVFLGNMSMDVTDDKIRELFKECGDITNIRWLVKNKLYTGKFKGKKVGFISFGNPDVALPIAMAFNGTDFCGQPLNMDYCKPR